MVKVPEMERSDVPPVTDVRRYTPLATIEAMRRIFEENRDLSFEARWSLAKASEAYVWLQTFCKTCARFLIVASLPIGLLLVIVRRNYPDGRPIHLDVGFHNLGDSLIVLGAIAYVAVSFVVGWRIGTAAANKQLGGSCA